MRRGVEAIQMTRLAPGGDGGYVHVQGSRGGLGRTVAITTLSFRARRRPFRAMAGKPVDIANPLDLARRERPAAATLASFGVEPIGDLAIGVVDGQDTDALDYHGWCPAGITRAGRPRDLHRGTDLGLPAQGYADGRGFLGQRDILDRQTQQLLAFGRCRGRSLPQRG